MPIQFLRIHDIQSHHFHNAMQIYRDSFPANEQHPIQTIEQRILSGRQELYVCVDSDQVMAFALLWNFEKLDFTLLDYLAVNKNQRGQQLGSQLLRYLKRITSKKGKHLVMEVENPSGEANPTNRINRIEFYLKNGAYIIKDTPYILPTLNNTTPTQMILMVIPFVNNTTFSPPQIADLITQLYIDLYGKTDHDATLIQLIHSIPSTITLTKSL